MNDHELTPQILAAMPIFPLPDCVLLPGGSLPLHVFEPRYRELTRDCLAGERVLAIARLLPGYEAAYDGRPPVHRTIGVGRVVASEEMPDGRFIVVLAGVARADIVEELAPRRAYREVQALLRRDTAADPDRLRAGHEQLVALVEHVAQLVDDGAGLRALIRAGDPADCADSVAAVLAGDPDERQELLECRSPEARLDMTIGLAGALLARLAPFHN